MPTLAIIDGISILMYPNDHAPPHFHVRVAGRTAKFDMAGRLIKGRLDNRKQRKVQLWTELNHDLLMQTWEGCRRR